MKTALTFLLLLCTATVFAQSTTSTSTPDTDKSKLKIGSKTDIRNPFDTTKVKAKTPVRENNNYIGETEKNKNNAARTDANIKNKKPEANNLGVGEDPFGKTKKGNSSKKKNGYANQEVSY